MSIIGILSLPVLLLSVAFILLHARFSGICTEHEKDGGRLRELLLHKLQLVGFFLRKAEADETVDGIEALIDVLAKWEEELEILELSAEDHDELCDINAEIGEALHMYRASKAKLDSFTARFPGRVFRALAARPR